MVARLGAKIKNVGSTWNNKLEEELESSEIGGKQIAGCGSIYFSSSSFWWRRSEDSDVLNISFEPTYQHNIHSYMPHGVMALTRKYKSCLHFEISKSDSKLGRATWLPHLIKMTRMRFCVYQMMVAYCLLSWLLPVSCQSVMIMLTFLNFQIRLHLISLLWPWWHATVSNANNLMNYEPQAGVTATGNLPIRTDDLCFNFLQLVSFSHISQLHNFRVER